MATSADLIREARLRAGLSQAGLSELTGKDRAQIARWERDAVLPSFETLRMLLRACGYDLSADLVAYEPATEPQLEELARLTPHERLLRHDERRTAAPGAADARWEPLELIAALERRRVAYVIIGVLARVIHGSDETTNAVEICPGMSESNRHRLDLALADIAEPPGPSDRGAPIETRHGRLVLIAEPAGRAADTTTSAGVRTAIRSARGYARRSRTSAI